MASIAPNLINYYPTYDILDNVVSSTDSKLVNVFIDLKGCTQSLYQEWAVRQIVNQSQGATHADNSIFASVLDYIAFHKRYAQKRDIKLRLFLFWEEGASTYHINIHPKYKSNRKNKLTFLSESQRDVFFRTFNVNLSVIEKICNRIPNVCAICLKHFEADFIPYYIRQEILGEYNDDEIDILYSLDKDMLQCFNSKFYIYYRHYQTKKILTQSDTYTHHFRKAKQNWTYDDIGPEWFPLFLSIEGDTGDDFKGVKGVGPAALIKNAKDIIEAAGGNIQDMYERIKNGKKIFVNTPGTNNNLFTKLLDNEDIVIRNLKLSSYRLISDAFKGGYPAAYIEKERNVRTLVKDDNNISTAQVLVDALKRNNMLINVSEQSVYDSFI